MKRIYKYSLGVPLTDVMKTTMPVDADIIHANIQNGLATIWAIVDSSNSLTEVRSFHVVGTGHDIPDNCKHIGTYFQGYFVWHIFEEIEC